MRSRLAAFLLACLAVPALALAADTDPKRKLNAADERKAASIVLRRADIGAGWKRTTSPNVDDDALNCPYYKPDTSDLTLTGDAEAEFEAAGGVPSLFSYADVYATTRDAAASWTRTVKPALARCFGDVFRREAAADPRVDVSAVTYSKLVFPKIAPRTAAFRVGVTVTYTQNGQSASVPIVLYVVVLGRGRAEAGIAAIAPKPGLTQALLRSLATALATRMQSAGF